MTLRPLDPFALPLVGTQLIEASAGTGKTYTITSIVLRLLLERGLTVDQVVVVTFTKAATFELRERIRRRIDEAEKAFRIGTAPADDVLLSGLLRDSKDHGVALARLQAAQRGLDHAAVFTIHGFAQRMLQEHAFESGARFDLELVGDQRALVMEVACDFWAREVATLPEAIWDLLSRVEPKSQLEPRAFVSLAYVASAFPELPLSGARSAAPQKVAEGKVAEGKVAQREVAQAELVKGPLSALSSLAASRKRLAEVFRSEGDAALALLSPTRQNARYYAVEKISAMKSELSRLIADEQCTKLSSLLGYLTNEKLETHTKSAHPTPKHALFDAIGDFGAACDEALEAGEALLDELRARMVHFAREKVVLEHRHAGTQSFDDLLQGLCVALRVKSGAVLARRIRERYPVALIDEFQDTDPTQYEIFRTIYASGGESKSGVPALFLIGDPKQAIYAFRGADVFAYIAAAKDAAEQAWTLATNRRSDPGLLDGLNTLFGRVPRPFLIDSIQYIPVSAPPERKDRLFLGTERVTPLELVYLEGEGGKPPAAESWSFLAAQEIARLLASDMEIEESGARRGLEPRDVAVLTRTNVQAQHIQEELRSLGIPSVLAGDRSVFETDEAEELASIMRAMAEPSSSGGVRTALATRFLHVGAAEIAELAEDEAAWERWVARFRHCHSLWTKGGFVHAIQHLFRELDVVSSTLTLAEGERRLTNVRHLIELLHGAETGEHLGVVGLLQWFDQARLDPRGQGMAPEAQQLRLESDADAVTLTTMHKSKGLEYPIVVLPSLGNASELFSSDQENLRFHNPAAGDALELDVRLPRHKPEQLAIGKQENRAEVMRLAYVALTRAKHHAIVLCGKSHKPAFSALGYLLHQPAVSLGGLEVDIEARLKTLDDAARFAELEQIAALGGGNIGVRRATLARGPSYEAARRALPELSARVLGHKIPDGMRTSSFSAMTRSAHALSPHARAGRDVDEVVASRSETGVTGATGPSEIVLSSFPRGATPGELLHAVFEHSEFAEGDAAKRGEVVDKELARQGFDVVHAPVLKQALEDALATPLDADATWSLGALTARARVAEMEFVLPVAARADGAQLTAQRLAHALGLSDPAHSQKRRTEDASAAPWNDVPWNDVPWDDAYLESVAKLEFQAWTGFLRGFIDLVFERDGRYFVLDYKSNHLGDAPDDYAVPHLRASMAEHHYYLQYLLYSVAVHRYLAQRVPRYDYDAHFGGAYYLFVRGMHPATGASRGVFFHRPDKALIERLSALLDDPAAEQEARSRSTTSSVNAAGGSA